MVELRIDLIWQERNISFFSKDDQHNVVPKESLPLQLAIGHQVVEN